MPTFQSGELLPKREIFQGEIPPASKEPYECSDPEAKPGEHGTELHQINGRGHGCELLILQRPEFWRRTAVKSYPSAAAGQAGSCS
jgi:hypothetical protein